MNSFKKIFCVIFILYFQSGFAANIEGYWNTVDKQTRLPTSVIAVYPYQGRFYGKVVASYNKQGVISETIESPYSRAQGIRGQPYYCGLDIICVNAPYGREPAKGHVVDPRSGKVYNAKLWVENGNLILRGELMMFGRNEVLIPCTQGHEYFPELSNLYPGPYKLNP